MGLQNKKIIYVGPYICKSHLVFALHEIKVRRTWHMSFLTGQDWTPKFAGQVMPDRPKSGLYFSFFYKLRIIDFGGYY